MDPVKFFLNKKERLPQRYAPKHLTKKDQKKQKKNLTKSRKLYKKGEYFERPKVKSFKSKKSRHLQNVEKTYGVKNMSIPELSKKTKCSQEALNKIVEKGQGAYYSSGSRPNQTGHSWGVARLASALTGGNSSVVDYNILEKGCKPTSKVLKLAKKQCKKVGRKCGNNKTKNKKNKKNKTKKIKGGDDDDDMCPICFETIEDNQEKFICEQDRDRRHVIHNECIRLYCQNFYGVFPCPVCRYINPCPRDREAEAREQERAAAARRIAQERERERAAARTAHRREYERAAARRREAERAVARRIERERAAAVRRIAQQEREEVRDLVYDFEAEEVAAARRRAPETIPPPQDDVNIYFHDHSAQDIRLDIIENFFEEEEEGYNVDVRRNALIPREDNTLSYFNLLSQERHGNEEPFDFYNGREEGTTDAEVDEIINNIGERLILTGGNEYTTYVDEHTHYYLAMNRYDDGEVIRNIWAIYGPGGVIENHGGQPLLRSREEVNANPPVNRYEQNNINIFENDSENEDSDNEDEMDLPLPPGLQTPPTSQTPPMPPSISPR